MYVFQSHLRVSKEVKRLYLTWECNILSRAKWQTDGPLHSKSNELAIAVGGWYREGLGGSEKL